MVHGCVYNIQRFSLHDGPGIRTTVFFKGCNLRCQWCHNPESIDTRPEIQEFRMKCIGCGKCLRVCPVQAQYAKDGTRVFARGLCTRCGACARNCYAACLVLAGKELTVDEVMTEVERDRVYYVNSKGGVTFSGGEPMLQLSFLVGLLKESAQRSISTAVDTAGNVPWRSFEEVIPYTDLFLLDVKVIDEDKHKQFTGVGNKKILDNFQKLSARGTRIIVRVPVIPGVNDTAADMGQIAGFIGGLKNPPAIELLTFHLLGSAKYESVGREYTFKDRRPPGKEDMQELGRVFSRKGLAIKVV